MNLLEQPGFADLKCYFHVSVSRWEHQRHTPQILLVTHSDNFYHRERIQVD